MNNKGFTLVELLVVVGILLIISLMSTVGITAVIERNKDKEETANAKIIVSAGILYAKNNRNKYDYEAFINGECGIHTDKLISANYLSRDDLEGDDNDELSGCVMYSNGEYTYVSEEDNEVVCTPC